MRTQRVSEVLRLEKRWVTVDPLGEYQEIGVRSFGRGIFHKEPVTGADLGNKRIRKIEPGDLVFSNVFAWEGAVALASDAESGKVGSHRFMTYVVAADEIDPRFLLYFFVSERGRRLLGQASPGSAGRNRTLAIERFEALEIPIPPLHEQRSLVASVEDAKRVVREATVAADAFDTARRQLLRSLTTPTKGPANAMDGEWDRVALGEVLSPASAATPVDPESEYTNLGVLSFARGLFRKPAIQGSETSARTLYQVREGQFLYSRLFAFEGAYAIVPPDFDGYFVSNEFPSFDIDTARVDPRFLIAYFRWPGVWKEVAAGSKGLGNRRQRVQVPQLLEHQIHLPSIQRQRAIGEAVERLDRTSVLRARVDELARALDSSVINSIGSYGSDLTEPGRS